MDYDYPLGLYINETTQIRPKGLKENYTWIHSLKTIFSALLAFCWGDGESWGPRIPHPVSWRKPKNYPENHYPATILPMYATGVQESVLLS